MVVTASRARTVAQSADEVKDRSGADVMTLRSFRANSSSSATVGNDRMIQSLDTGTLFETADEMVLQVAACGLFAPH